MNSNEKIEPKKNFKTRILNWFGLTDETTIKVYHGYGYADHLVVYGHVFKLGPLPRKRYTKSVVDNTLALLRLFVVKPYPRAKLRIEWQGQFFFTETDEKGFFKFEWQDEPPLEQGWNQLIVEMTDEDRIVAQGEGSVYVPHATQFGFISDIDDTFLVSHSANMRKRLFVLFTQNARSRQPFEGVVRHYQLLANGNTTPDAPNPFFYVSSSEWNLYDYLLEFTTKNGIPRGIFLLNMLKQFNELLKTGQNNHDGKFTRIVRILEGFPKQRFVLLGDSSQQDPYIYEAVAKYFPKQIHAVYIRDVYKKSKEAVSQLLESIEANGVPCCFFTHSSEAILHSRKIGLIEESDAIKELSAERVDEENIR